MKIRFCGAAQCVTGSCYYVECSGYKFIVDCGMFQGKDADKNDSRTFPFDESKLDFVLLTHAHTDHAGRLPLLVKNGFKGKIYATPSTIKLSEIMLYDSAHIQSVEAEWTKRKNKRGSLEEAYSPMYDTLDVDATLPLFEEVEYDQILEICPNVSVRFQDAGHLLGSASIEVFLKEKNKEVKVVFSGDLGNLNQPLIKNNPTFIKDADIVLTESTYGDELHKVNSEHITTLDRAKRLATLVDETFKKKGNLVIPAFAVGRTQEILYLFKLIDLHHLLPYSVPVYVDSPMAIKATTVFQNENPKNFDEETRALIEKHENPLFFPSLHISSNVEDSKAINTLDMPVVIISSSGMCSQGRIKHHLKYNLWRPESTILFTGFQAGGTLGRSIVDGAKYVTIFGEKIKVEARIEQFSSLSGHADQSGIINWLKYFNKDKLKMVFVVHGEKDSTLFFQDFINKELGLNAYSPIFEEEVDILKCIKEPLEPRMHYSSKNDTEHKAIKAAINVLKARTDELNKMIKDIEKLTGSDCKKSKGTDWEDVNAILTLAHQIEELTR